MIFKKPHWRVNDYTISSDNKMIPADDLQSLSGDNDQVTAQSNKTLSESYSCNKREPDDNSHLDFLVSDSRCD